MEFKPRFFQNPQQSFFLFGPRGTGKTMWLKENLTNAIFVDLLDPEVYRGKERLIIRDVLCLPAEEFLMNLMPGKPTLW